MSVQDRYLGLWAISEPIAMRNRHKRETLSLGEMFERREIRRNGAEIKRLNNELRAGEENAAVVLVERLKAAWTAFKSGPAKPGHA